MADVQLNLKPGTWLVSDCGKMPSDSNCQLVMLAPLDQKKDLVDAGVKHMVDKHGHEDNDETRTKEADYLEEIEIA